MESHRVSGIEARGGMLRLWTWEQQLEAMDLCGNDHRGCRTVGPAPLAQIGLITSVNQSQLIYRKPVSHELEGRALPKGTIVKHWRVFSPPTVSVCVCVCVGAPCVHSDWPSSQLEK